MAKADQQHVALNKSLIAAAAASSISKVRAALDFGANPNFKDPSQFEWTPLHFACYFSGSDRSADKICGLLVQRGADPDAKAADGSSPLMTAAAMGSLCAVELLLGKRAKIDAADSRGLTPLMGAAERGDEAIVHVLLLAGANPELRNAKGESAIEMAQAKQLHAIAAQIESSMLIRETKAGSRAMAACR